MFRALSLLALSALISLQALASSTAAFNIEEESMIIAEACSSLESDSEIVECLNTQAQNLLNDKVDAAFRADLQEKVDAFDLALFDINKIAKLSDLYTLYIPSSNEFDEKLQCFNLSNTLEIRKVSRRLVNLALFIKKYAVSSYGRPFSPFIGFKKVALCDNQEWSPEFLRLDLEQKTLRVGTHPGSWRYRELTVRDIWEAWQEGDAVNPLLNHIRLPFFAKLNYKIVDKDKIIYEAIYQKWSLLNPTGDIRETARTMATLFAYAQLEEVLSSNIHDFLKRSFSLNKDQFTRANMDWSSVEEWLSDDPQKLDDVVDRIREPELINKVLAKHITVSRRLCQGAQAKIDSKRKQDGRINFINAKAVSVDVELDFPFEVYDQLSEEIYADPDYCASVVINSADSQKGYVNINLIDGVAVSVMGLGSLGEAFKLLPQIALATLYKESQKESRARRLINR